MLLSGSLHAGPVNCGDSRTKARGHQADSDFDISALVGSAAQSESETIGHEEDERRAERKAYREHQHQKSVIRSNAIHTGIQNKNIALLMPKGSQAT